MRANNSGVAATAPWLRWRVSAATSLRCACPHGIWSSVRRSRRSACVINGARSSLRRGRGGCGLSNFGGAMAKSGVAAKISVCGAAWRKKKKKKKSKNNCQHNNSKRSGVNMCASRRGGKIIAHRYRGLRDVGGRARIALARQWRGTSGSYRGSRHDIACNRRATRRASTMAWAYQA